MATIKKPIVLYGGLMKQIQPGDVTPGQHDASIALSYAKLAEGDINASVAELSIVSSECCASGRSVAVKAESWAEAAESIARALDINGVASEAYSLAYRAESVGQWAENRASHALSSAKEAVEISDISEAASVGEYGVSIGRVAEDIGEGAQSTGVRAESLAREASVAAGGGLDQYSEAMLVQSETAFNFTSDAYSVGTRAESLARKEAADAESTAIDYASTGLSQFEAGGSEAVAQLSEATSETFSIHDGRILDAQSTGVRGESLARTAKSAAYVYTDNLSESVKTTTDNLSVSTINEINNLSTAVNSDINDLSAAVWSSFATQDEYVSEAIAVSGNNSSEGISYAISVGEHAYSTAVLGIDRGDDAASIGMRGESLARLAQEAEVTYDIAFGSNREGRFVYKTGVGNQVALANASDEATMPAFGIITYDGDTTVQVRQLADMIDSVKVDSDASPIAGANIFISSVESGKVTNIAPNMGVSQRIGNANRDASEGYLELNMRIGEAVVL